MVRLLLAALLVCATSLLCAMPGVAQEAVTLKPGPGQNAATTSCAVCHTLNYIRMNSVFLTPDAWKAEVTKMREAYGAPIDDDTANTIVKYLSDTYAAQTKS
jgi:mono/diheme cytochrome c family protein